MAVLTIPGVAKSRGLWTPALTFATPGTLSVSYGTQLGAWIAFDEAVLLIMALVTSAFTPGTASGAMLVTGLPFPAANIANQNYYSACNIAGYTKAGYTSVLARLVGNTSQLDFVADGSGNANALLQAADMPSGGTIVLTCNLPYLK